MEILDKILNNLSPRDNFHFRGHLPDLTSLCSVSTALNKRIVPRLYHTFTVARGHAGLLEKFLRTVWQEPALASLVHEVDVEEWEFAQPHYVLDEDILADMRACVEARISAELDLGHLEGRLTLAGESEAEETLKRVEQDFS